MKAKKFKNYISILAIVNYRNWLDASTPLIFEINGTFCSKDSTIQLAAGKKLF